MERREEADFGTKGGEEAAVASRGTHCALPCLHVCHSEHPAALRERVRACCVQRPSTSCRRRAEAERFGRGGLSVINQSMVTLHHIGVVCVRLRI